MMRLFMNLALAIYRKLSATKQVSRMNATLADIVNFFYTIYAINQLGEDETMFNGRLLSEWRIPSGISIFFYPAAVRMDVSSKLSQDVLKRSGVQAYEYTSGKDKDNKDIKAKARVLTYPEFIEVLDVIAGLYKGKVDRNTDIASLRKVVSIADVYAKGTSKRGKGTDCHWDGVSYYLPLPLDCELGLKPGYFNATCQEVLDELVLDTQHIFQS